MWCAIPNLQCLSREERKSGRKEEEQELRSEATKGGMKSLSACLPQYGSPWVFRYLDRGLKIAIPF